MSGVLRGNQFEEDTSLGLLANESKDLDDWIARAQPQQDPQQDPQQGPSQQLQQEPHQNWQNS